MQTVTAAILMKNGKILIARRKTDDRQANKWEFPGGTVEPNEDPPACLKREMQEEFGIKVSVGSFFGESVYHYDHGWIKLLAYRTHWESGKIVIKDHADYRWVSSTQLAEYDFSPADIAFVEKLQRLKVDQI
jgi:8-oxo-dGTP diphosphatase